MAKAAVKETWEEGTCWLESTDKEGFVSHTENRCWNVTRFLKKQFAYALKEGGSCKQITEAEYKKAIGWGKRKKK